MLGHEKPSPDRQVDADHAALSWNGASRRGTRVLWTGLGFAVLMLIGCSACALLPTASQASATPSRHVPMVAFNPSLPALSPGGIRPTSSALRKAGVKRLAQWQPISGPRMSAAPGPFEYSDEWPKIYSDILDAVAPQDSKVSRRSIWQLLGMLPVVGSWPAAARAENDAKEITVGARKDITDLVFGPPGTQKFAAEWPYTARDMSRIDESDDTQFYTMPKLVYHIDEGARAALTKYYKKTIPPGSDILDIASSWVSHYPEDFPKTMKSIRGTGMNKLELSQNKQFTGGFVATDLNKKPVLPYPDKSFDVVTIVVSIDYLNQPREIFKEVSRVLKPGGRFILSQSNRLFFTKAVARWLALDDYGRLKLIGDYAHYSNAGFGPPRAFDISATGPGANDPMYIVEVTKA